jgi:2-keto-4-pentenoate hydratase/2-oxohepta-3-ene-1,7-dioic acid hydratase in catechol pathway
MTELTTGGPHKKLQIDFYFSNSCEEHTIKRSPRLLTDYLLPLPLHLKHSVSMSMPYIYMQASKSAIPVSNIFCVGRNYAAHAAEMGSPLLETPMIFLKPTSALAYTTTPITLPNFSNDIHYETELVVLIGKSGSDISTENALDYVAGYAIGLDLTARDIQAQAKTKGHPWTLAKGFKGSACVSDFIPRDQLPNAQECYFELTQNNQVKQRGDTRLMLFTIPTLIHYISSVFGLTEGDLIFTGTPEGVGKISSGDTLSLQLADIIFADFTVS